MSYHDPEEFSSLKDNLASLFVSTAAQFASNCGLERLQEKSLAQLSPSLEDVAGEVLMFGSNAWPASAQPAEAMETPCPFEINPSEVDPPRHRALLWSLATFLITVPLAFLIYAATGAGAGYTLGFGVLVVAVMFGTTHALLLSALSPILSDLLVTPPIFVFSWPTATEALSVPFYMAIALVVPWLIRRAYNPRQVALAK